MRRGVILKRYFIGGGKFINILSLSVKKRRLVVVLFCVDFIVEEEFDILKSIIF